MHRTDQGGPATDMNDFFTNERSQAQFKAKLAWLTQRFGNNRRSSAGNMERDQRRLRQVEAYMPWTQPCSRTASAVAAQPGSAEPRQLRPHLVARTLPPHSLMPGNDLAQVHRYLDCGAAWDVCHGPWMCSPPTPCAKCSRSSRAGPCCSRRAARSSLRMPTVQALRQGHQRIILHDVLFAPFFAGAAGPALLALETNTSTATTSGAIGRSLPP